MFDSIKLRKGQPDLRLDHDSFLKEFKKSFYDPNFDSLSSEISKIAEVAWQNYEKHRKAPRTVKAGGEFKNPDYDLSVEWFETRNNLLKAQAAQKNAIPKILIVNASPRNEHTCPGEISKSFRLSKVAEDLIAKNHMRSELLDLSRLTSEYDKKILPCKACVSTAMPLCHWPCSCYPNHSLAQTGDWMSEIYEKWVSAHGILIITPVHWYQAPSALKLMMDRMVCADGGNPDPTSTNGKDAEKAKKIELAGWDYPKHLAGRAFALVVHGDSAGAENVRRILTDWLDSLELVQAGKSGVLDKYIGYYQPYATSHDELDKNKDFITEVETTTLALVHQVQQMRNEQYVAVDEGLKHPMQK